MDPVARWCAVTDGRRKPYEPDRIRVDKLGDWHRASGEVVCEVCGCVYYDHPPVTGYEWLRRTCAGKLVKL